MSAIASNLQAVRGRIALCAQRASRPAESVRLIAVSKTQNAAAVHEAALAGQCDFGENYVQEALDKMAVLERIEGTRARALEWHMIGPIQTNKTRAIAEHFDWVHSVDRLRVAERLSAQRPQTLPPLNLCLQVNISGETSKSGVAPQQLTELAFTVAALPRIRLAGLMAIPAPSAPADSDAGRAAARAPFAALARLRDDLAAAGLPLPELSMGMSDDFELAIAAGATLVRVGTAIFGARQRALLDDAVLTLS